MDLSDWSLNFQSNVLRLVRGASLRYFSGSSGQIKKNISTWILLKFQAKKRNNGPHTYRKKTAVEPSNNSLSTPQRILELRAVAADSRKRKSETWLSPGQGNLRTVPCEAAPRRLANGKLLIWDGKVGTPPLDTTYDGGHYSRLTQLVQIPVT